MIIFLSIFFFLLTCYAILIDFYRKSWNKIPEFIETPLTDPPLVSVVIAVRNEEENIPGLLDSLRQQTYPASHFEVIIVDDHSTDSTWDLLQSFTGGMPTIRALKLGESLTDGETIKAHKKLAIEMGIKTATGELIVTSDADCRFQPDWLAVIASCYKSTGSKFIAAPVKITNNGSFISIFQSLDFLTLQGITGASVYRRFHTMCNGANLAYARTTFFEAGGFAGIDNIPSGDDMLLMYKIYKLFPDSVIYLKNSRAIVSTRPVLNWKAFFNQRIRWASKATHYDDKKIFWILLLVYAVNVCFLVLAIASFMKATWFFFFFLLLLAKTLVEFPFVNAVAIFFSETKLMKYFPLMQPFHLLYTVLTGWLGKFGSYEWKGRRIKQ